MLIGKYGWAVQKSLFAETNQDSIFSHTYENSKMFNITSKYFSFFNNKPPASWVVHITRDFLACYSCSNYSSMPLLICYFDIKYVIKHSSDYRFFILVKTQGHLVKTTKSRKPMHLLKLKALCLPSYLSILEKWTSTAVKFC